MFINAEKLNEAMGFVTSIANLDKTPPGIMFNIKDDSIVVIYSTGDRAIQHEIPAAVAEDEIHGSVIFDYQRLADTLLGSKASGIIKVNDVEFKLDKKPDGSGIANIKIVKAIDIPGNEGEEDTSRVVSVNNHELSWWSPETATLKQKALTKPVCEDIFDENGAETWDSSEFLSMLNGVNSGDAKVVYVSPNINGAFENNTNSLVYTKSKTEFKHALVMTTNIIPSLTTIFSKTDDMMVNTIENDGKLFACIFFTPEHKTAVYTKAGTRVQTHGVRMQQNQKIAYRDLQASFMSDVLKDILKSAVSLNSAVNGVIKFVPSDDGVNMVITAENSGASVNNTYNVACTSFNSNIEVDENSDHIMKFTVNLKQFYDEISRNKCNYTALDFFCGPDRTYMRIGFFDIEEAARVREQVITKKHNEMSEAGEAVDLTLTSDEKMDMRDNYIETFIYIVTV